MRRDRLLIPLKTKARHIRYVQQSIPDFVRPLQDRIGPILPFEPMRRFGHTQQMRRHLRIEMR